MSLEKKVTYEDLEELLKDDNKVKVGGEPVPDQSPVAYAVI
jgi:hypothetical protein